MSLSNSIQNRNIALYWIKEGFAVYPAIGKGDKYKQPVISWKDNPITTKEKVNEIWTDNVCYIVGISLKNSGYIVIDCDVKGEENGINNFLNFLEKNNINYNDIFYTKTPSQGRHYYFKLPPNISEIPQSTNKFLPNVDIRGTESCVIAKGSITLEGKKYEHEENSLRRIKDTMVLPPCIYEKIKQEEPYIILTELPPPTVIKRPDHNDKQLQKYLQTAVNQELNKITSAPKGTRNSNLNEASFVLAGLVKGGYLQENEIQFRLLNAALSIGLKKPEIMATIKSGFKAAQPRTIRLENNNDIDYIITTSAKIIEENKISEEQPEVEKPDYINFYFDDMPAIDVDSPLYHEIKNIINDNSPWLHENYAKGVTFSILSTLMGRAFITPLETQISLYIILIGKTGCGKGAYVQAPSQILSICPRFQNFLGRGEITSDASLEKLIKQMPVSLNIYDEFEELIMKITNVKKDDITAGISKMLRMFWGMRLNEVFITKETLEREAEPFYNIIFNILGASTPSPFMNALNPLAFENGLLNRMLFFPSEKPPHAKNRKSIILSPELKRKILDINKLAEPLKNYNSIINDYQTKIVPYENDSVKKLFIDFQNNNNNVPEPEIVVRCAEQALRLATILAVSRDHKNPKIKESDMLYAINITKQSANYAFYIKEVGFPRNKDEAYIKEMRHIIKMAGAKGITMFEIFKKFQGIPYKKKRFFLEENIKYNNVEVLKYNGSEINEEDVEEKNIILRLKRS